MTCYFAVMFSCRQVFLAENELIGPPQKCVGCGDEFPFAAIKSHSDECMRYLRFIFIFF